jgi:hypothetical protein
MNMVKQMTHKMFVILELYVPIHLFCPLSHVLSHATIVYAYNHPYYPSSYMVYSD